MVEAFILNWQMSYLVYDMLGLKKQTKFIDITRFVRSTIFNLNKIFTIKVIQVSEDLNQARDHFIQGMSRITHFWGFPKAMGAVYGAIYLSPTPVSLDELAKQVMVSKESVGTHIHTLERLNIVHKQADQVDDEDYYTAEADFWQVMKSIMQERETNEFSLALRTVDESLDMVDEADMPTEEAYLSDFYQERIRSMQDFFSQFDLLISTLLSLDVTRLNALIRVFGNSKNKI